MKVIKTMRFEIGWDDFYTIKTAAEAMQTRLHIIREMLDQDNYTLKVLKVKVDNVIFQANRINLQVEEKINGVEVKGE